MPRSLSLGLPTTEQQPLGETTPTVPKSLGEWRGLVGRAFGRSGLTQKVAASELGITESALSKQLAGAEHLSFWRMHSLPVEFWRELIVQIAEFHAITLSGTQQDAEDAAIGRLVRDAVKRCR